MAEGEWREIQVDVKGDENYIYDYQHNHICVWRLFSDKEGDEPDVDEEGNTLISQKQLDYEVYFYGNQTENVEIYLFDFDMSQGNSILEEV